MSVLRQLLESSPVQYPQNVLAQWVGTRTVPCSQDKPTKTLYYNPTDGVSNST